MMKLETGDVLLKRGKTNPLSWMIRLATGSPYTHAGIVYNGPVIAESFMFGVEPVSLNRLKPADVFRFKGSIKTGLIRPQKMKLLSFCNEAIKKEINYDYIQLIAYTYYSIFGGVNKFNNPRKYICTEFVDRAYKEIDINLVKDRPTGDLTPKDLAESQYLEKVGELR